MVLLNRVTGQQRVSVLPDVLKAESDPDWIHLSLRSLCNAQTLAPKLWDSKQC